MRVSFPHLGHLWVPVRALFTELGVDHVVPPLNTRRTLTLATDRKSTRLNSSH